MANQRPPSGHPASASTTGHRKRAQHHPLDVTSGIPTPKPQPCQGAAPVWSTVDSVTGRSGRGPWWAVPVEKRADLAQRRLLGSTASPAGRSQFIHCRLELPPSQERNADGTIPFSLKVIFYFPSPIPCSYSQPIISTCLLNTLHQSVRPFTQSLGCAIACGLLRWPGRDASDSNPVCSGHTPDT